MKCPGQDMRSWRPGDIFDVECPFCGNQVEFFKDEIKHKCSRCSKEVPNPRKNFSCVLWCEYAKQCVGEKLHRKLVEEFNDEGKGNL